MIFVLIIIANRIMSQRSYNLQYEGSIFRTQEKLRQHASQELSHAMDVAKQILLG
jgi:hypothetical protein